MHRSIKKTQKANKKSLRSVSLSFQNNCVTKKNILDQGPSDNRSTLRTWLPDLLRAIRPTNSNCCQINAWPDKSVALLIFMTIVLIFIMYFTGLFTGYLPF